MPPVSFCDWAIDSSRSDGMFARLFSMFEVTVAHSVARDPAPAPPWNKVELVELARGISPWN